jgi:hypothetical protein
MQGRLCVPACILVEEEDVGDADVGSVSPGEKDLANGVDSEIHSRKACHEQGGEDEYEQ